MGAVPAPSPIGFGGNNLANNLENGIQTANGSVLAFNGLKNYATYGTFQSGLNGWAVGTVGTLTNGLPNGTPTFNTTSTGLTVALNSATPISAITVQSIQLVCSTASAGGMVASPAFAIDSEGQAKALQFKHSYRLDSGTANLSGTLSNSFAAAVWDVTNSTWLASSFNFVQGSGVGTFTVIAQTAPTTASVRLCIYLPTAVAAANLSADNFYYGPQISSSGPAMSDPAAATYTLTNAGNATVTGTVSQLGAFCRFAGSIVIGSTLPTGTITLNIPSGFTFVNTTGTAEGTCYAAHGVVYTGSPVFASSASINFYGPNTNVWNATTPVTFAAGDTIGFAFQAQIVGKSSNTAQSADSSQNVVAFSVNTSSNTASTTAPMIFTNVLDDSAGGYSVSTGQYKVAVTGRYAFDSTYYTGTTTQTAGVYKNGTLIAQGSISTNGVAPGNVHWEGPCVPGDLIDIRPQNSSSGSGAPTQTTFSGYRLSGPAVVQATDLVCGSYTDTSGGAIGTSAAVYSYGTKLKDTQSIYSSGTLTIPVSGEYDFGAYLATTNITLSTAQYFLLAILRNGTQIASDFVYGNGATSNSYMLKALCSYPCLQGDQIIVKALCNVATTANTGVGNNNFFWKLVK